MAFDGTHALKNWWNAKGEEKGWEESKQIEWSLRTRYFVCEINKINAHISSFALLYKISQLWLEKSWLLFGRLPQNYEYTF